MRSQRSPSTPTRSTLRSLDPGASTGSSTGCPGGGATTVRVETASSVMPTPDRGGGLAGCDAQAYGAVFGVSLEKSFAGVSEGGRGRCVGTTGQPATLACGQNRCAATELTEHTAIHCSSSGKSSGSAGSHLLWSGYGI